MEKTPRSKPKEQRARNNIRFGRMRQPYAHVKPQIEEVLRNKIIIGYSLNEDFKTLGLDPRKYTLIDTAKLPIFMQRHKQSSHLYRLQPKTLKNLTKQHLKKQIQDGIHDSLIDAIANMELFLKFKEDKLYTFPHPFNTIEVAQRVSEDARRYGLLHPKYKGPDLLQFPQPVPPTNYTANLEQVFPPNPRGHLITKHMVNLPVPPRYGNNLEGLFPPATSGQLINTHMANLPVMNNLLGLNAPPRANTRRNRYAQNLEGLLPAKPKSAWQKVKNMLSRKKSRRRV